MAAYPVVVVGDGVIEIPEEFRDDPRFQKGAALELVPIQTSSTTGEGSRKDWRLLEGILADPNFDATEWKRQEREWELAHDERKFGTARPDW